MTNNEPKDCYLPGWDEGFDPGDPDLPLECELPDDHAGPHAAFPGTIGEITWPITWVMDEEEWTIGN